VCKSNLYKYKRIDTSVVRRNCFCPDVLVLDLSVPEKEQVLEVAEADFEQIASLHSHVSYHIT
jgi:hypothetical protein